MPFSLYENYAPSSGSPFTSRGEEEEVFERTSAKQKPRDGFAFETKFFPSTLAEWRELMDFDGSSGPGGKIHIQKIPANCVISDFRSEIKKAGEKF